MRKIAGHLSERISRAMADQQPVISVDTKKKELVGDFKIAGRELRPKGDPAKVRVYDFKDKELGKANPYGIYDLDNNSARVSVGTDHDTAWNGRLAMLIMLAFSLRAEMIRKTRMS